MGRVRKIINDSFVIALIHIKPVLRNPSLILGLIIISFFPVFIIAMSGGLIDYGFIGAICAGVIGSGISISADIVYNKEWYKFQDMLVAAPVSPISYALGLSIFSLLQVIPDEAIFIGIAMYQGIIRVSHLPLLVALLIMGWLCFGMLGFTIATYTKSVNIGTISTVLSFLFSILPPVYYSLYSLPKPLQWVALLIPSTYLAEALRSVVGLSEANLLRINVAALTIFLIIFTLLTIKGSRWREP